MKKNIFSLIFNIILVVAEIIGIVLSIKSVGFTLEFYTQNSNMFALLVSLIFIVFMIKNLINKTKSIPKWLSLLKYISVVSLTITFLVTLFILTPTMKEVGGIKVMLFSGSMLYLHTLCPIIAIISFILFENCHVKGWKDALIASAFTITYGVITTILNITRTMYGPYPFLHVYEQPIYISIIWFILIIGGSYLIAYIFQFLNRKFLT